MSFVRARIGACVSACRILDCKKICDSPLTSGTGALLYEFRETRTGPWWSRCSSGLRVEPILVRLMTKVGFCLVLKESAIFDSLAPNAFGVEIVSKH
jgi:hypothetical protein